MHHIYTTKAFVVHSFPHGESGKFLLLFTKDFGLVGAVAQGIRFSKSKLRSHLIDFGFANVSLVRGKEVWRVTGAQEIEHQKKNIIQIKILRLLKRLLHGEEKNEKLFEIVEKLYQIEIDETDFDNVECLTVLRILNSLGYISKNDKYSNLLESTDIDHGQIDLIKEIKPEIIKTINQSLKESHL
ncbi:MAG TPA: recombination protein O N-terminal domain-containing protein [Candidatus Paceibacterota bacterium]